MLTIGAPTSNKSDPTQSRQSQEQRSLDDAFRKANGILHGDSGALDSTLLSIPSLENSSEADASMAIKNPREKRSALGHKPAQFSLRPNITQASADLEVNLNIDQLHDPVDFFSAYGKLQYAEDEIERHTCGGTNINDYIPSANPRSRQPGILGKSVAYMHQYSSVVSDNEDTFLSSREAIQDDSLCPSKFVWQQETAHSDIDLQGKELVESISETEHRINELLDKLLSESIEILDGDGAPSLVQKGLQKKPVNVEKYLPDFSGTRRTSIIGLEKELPQNRKSQTDIPKLMRGLSGKTPVKSKHVAENPVHTLASPTTPKSPFAALSLLNKHSSKSKPMSDPFMALDIDLSSARNASSVEEFHGVSQQPDEGKELTIYDKVTSLTEVEATRTTAAGMVSKNSIERVTPNLLNESVNVNPSRSRTSVVALGHGLCNMDNNVEDVHQNTASSLQPNVNTDGSTTKNINFSHSPSGQSDSTFKKGLLVKGQPIAADSTFRKDLKQHNKALRKGSAKDLTKATHEQKRRKAINRSLIESGTYWESGVRHSKRIRTRPLEYWKGERFLYGRVHESLATVIGIKYMSPAEDSGEPTFRVSSYVSDKHKELVELAARH